MSSNILAVGVKTLITPECENLTKSLKWSSLFSLILLTISLILLFVAVIYNYVKKTTVNSSGGGQAPSQDEEEKKQKVIAGLSITSVISVSIAFLIKIWDFTIATKTVKTCLSNNS
jgi:hypothetical protein